jgi:hypothetical protein
VALHIVAARPSQQLLTLPWQLPLERWPDECQVAMSRGISRHVVRFVRVDHQVYAAKETREEWAWREYGLLRNLRRLGLPTVEPIGVVTGRQTATGDDLEPCLLTRHLAHSLSYRALFSQRLQLDTVRRVLDALVVLLVRLHVEGFWWGDCSLSNTLFRRSAGEFAAYLVDAETGELHTRLSDGQRAHDLDLVTTNVFGELLDLQAGGLLDDQLEPHELVARIQQRYETLWAALTGVEEFDTNEMWRIEQRVNTLQELGFDVEELDIVTDFDGATVRIRPAVVEAGHHSRRLQGLTGLDVEEPQARRLLNDLDAFTASANLQDADPTIVAHRWLTEVYEPLRAMVPPELHDRLEPAELFHEILEHRWYLSERKGREVDLFDAARIYIDEVLPSRAQTVSGAMPASFTTELEPALGTDDDLVDS